MVIILEDPVSSQTEIDLFGNLFADEEDFYEESEASVSCCDDVDEDDLSVTPGYLLTAILAGLYEIPPFHILRHQTGWGRRVRYDPTKLIRIKPNFRRIGMLLSENNTMLELEEMELQKYSYTDQQQFLVNDFCIYRVQVKNHEHLNQTLKAVAREEHRLNPHGLDVSNAGGGWHGQPHFFQHERWLYRICIDVIQTVEKRQPNPTLLQLEPENIECWINISQNGSWNRLHTHEGSVWSGVYYVDNGDSPLHQYGGRMLLKPTAHPKEETYKLSDLEKGRLRINTKIHESVDVDACEYMEVHPIPGHMMLFPGWLHHCVLPLSQLDSHCQRISIAFNINENIETNDGRCV